MGRREWQRSMPKGKREALPAGCMSGVLHLFDFHHILFAPSGSRGRRAPQGPSSQPRHCPSQLKGVEAPRNSLELDEAAAATAMSTASAVADDDYFGVPMGIHVNAVPRITKKQINKEDLLMLVEEERRTSSHCGTPRTPNVVARLMGLEILPDGASTPTPGFRSRDHSPKFITKKKMASEKSYNEYVDGPRKGSPPPPPPRRQPLQKRDANIILPNVRLEVGTRSLPDTPRASSERSREDPRLSLQLSNKENINRATHLCEVSRSLPPSPVACTANYMNSRPRRKDSFTNQSDESKSPRSHYYAREIVKQVKESIHRRESPNNGDTTNFLVKSRRTRPTDKRVVVVVSAENESKNLSASSSPPPARFFEPPKARQAPPKENVDPNKCKRASVERFTERIRRQPPPSETAAQSSCALKNRALQPSTSSSDRPPSPDRSHRFQNRIDTKEQDPELLYVRSILERAGIMNTRPTATVPRWYSPSLPIDPFVFHQLELDLPVVVRYNPGPLRHRCNRKLLFHLVEEILSDLLGGPTSKGARFHVIGSNEMLLDGMWSQIRGFPLADCQVIEDIDELVAGDIAEAKVRRLLGHPLVEAEAEGIAAEIEGDVLDSVVGEAAATLALCSRSCNSNMRGGRGCQYPLLRHSELRAPHGNGRR